MGDRRFLAAAVLLCTLLPVTAAAQLAGTALGEGEPIHVDAQQITYDQKTDTIVARGAVLITRGTTELRADEVRLHRSTNEAEAYGNVHLTDPEGSVTADEMQLNLDDETGSLEVAEITSRRFQYTVWGQRVEKGLGQTYRIENGRFTSCHCGDRAPDWSLSGKELQLTAGGYGDLTAGTFNVLDVPILYVPRAIIPANRDRASGFLLPRLGVSNLRGFQMVAPFYWAIDKSQDATVGLDVETSARVGLPAEYRYILGPGMHGELSASYFNESFRQSSNPSSFEPHVPINRWSVMGTLDQALLGDARAYSDLTLVGDDLFFRDMNAYSFDRSREIGLRTLPYTASRLGVLQEWDRLVLKPEATYYRNLTSTQSAVLQRAPAVEAWGQVPLGPALGAIETSAVDYQRGSSVTGFRLDVRPSLNVPLPLGPLAFGSVDAALRGTAYHLIETDLLPNEQPPGLSQLPRNQSRGLVEVRSQAGTVLDRIYAVQWFGLEKIKHTIEPTVEYLYIPAVDQSEQPFFDGIDRINHRNLLTYGMVSRFIGKFANPETTEGDGEQDQPADASPPSSGGGIRELGRLSLFQSYDISREINPLQTGRSADHFSDIDFGGRINPSRFLNLRFLTNYDAGHNNISAARVGLFVEDPFRTRSEDDTRRLDTRTSAAVSYRVLTQNLLQEIDGNVVLRLTDWAGFLYATRYDLVAKRFLDTRVGLRLISTCDCWALDLAFTDRTNPQEVSVQAQLTLAGFGSFGSGQSGTSRVARLQ